MADKVRIFSLAKELGMDSKVLIEHCRAAGLTVKGSALASISPEEKQLVLDHIAQSGDSVPETSEVDLAPTREHVPELTSRLREMRTMAPKERPRAAEPELEAPVEEPAVVDEVVGEETPSPAEPESPPADVPEVAASTEEVVQTDDVEPPDASDEIDAVTREDYQPHHGGGAPREMRPVGTPTHSDLPVRREKTRSRPSLPGLAAIPQFKPQESRKKAENEPKAQKPEIRLAPEEYDAASPLAQRLKQAAEDKSRRKGGGAVKGKDSTFQEEEEKRSRGMGSLDSTRSERRKQRQRTVGRDDDDGRGRRSTGVRRKKRSGPVELKSSAVVEFPLTVRSLSEAIGRPAKQIISILWKRGEMATINQTLEEEDAWEIAAELGVELEVRREQTGEEFLDEIIAREEPEELLQTRPPVVTILGHVDHGKTSLLDKIRETNVVAGEAGGITQHIRSYQVEHGGRQITFVDTPGHAAFGEMRARGANVTDIIVLVVAANDSVMPQTVECISHAKASGAPVIVAMNKCDLPNINEQKVLTDLSVNGVQPQEWGGDVEVIRTSAMSGQGIDDLLETILLTAEIGELKANPECDAVGICLEAFQDEGVGPIAWVIVQKGTLRVGDQMLIGQACGRVRNIYNDRGESIMEAPPSLPVKVTGLDVVPGAGDHFFVLDDIEKAREIAAERKFAGRTEQLAGRNRPRTLDDILNAARDGAVQDLNVILKADTPGSIEALKSEIGKLDHPEVRVQVLHEAVGGVNESDVYLASASDAVIIAFHVIAEDRAVSLADQEGVEIRRYDIIYEVTDHIRNTLEGLLIPEKIQVATGRAIVLQTFSVSRTGTIAGCRILNGTIERNHRIHVIRDQKVLNDYPIASLRRVKDDVKEVREGMECGIRLDGFNDVKEGDLLEAFRIDEVKRKLDD
jgi:translation initiation factor IF-2